MAGGRVRDGEDVKYVTVGRYYEGEIGKRLVQIIGEIYAKRRRESPKRGWRLANVDQGERELFGSPEPSQNGQPPPLFRKETGRTLVTTRLETYCGWFTVEIHRTQQILSLTSRLKMFSVIRPG